MIKILGKIPERNFGVACSGGVDSMVALSFCVMGNRKPYVLWFDHGIPEDVPGFHIVKKYCSNMGLLFLDGKIDTPYKQGLSREEHWRIERYKWLNSFDFPIITGHHLNDVMETWVFSSIHGNPKLIPYETKNIIRPFLMNTKQTLEDWAVKHCMLWHNDILNDDISFSRNRIRHNIVPEILKVNKGFHTTLRNKIRKKYENSQTPC